MMCCFSEDLASGGNDQKQQRNLLDDSDDGDEDMTEESKSSFEKRQQRVCLLTREINLGIFSFDNLVGQYKFLWGWKQVQWMRFQLILSRSVTIIYG